MWKFKIVDGKIVMDGDKPVVIKPDGTEIAYDIATTMTTIGNLTNEAATHRKAAETAADKLKSFEGLDPAAAREAFDKLSKIDQKKLIDAGQVDAVKAEISKAYDAKLAEADKRFGELQNNFHKTIRTNQFAKSAFIKDKLTLPADIAEAVFGTAYEVDDKGNVVAKQNGMPIQSPNHPGQNATFDEALEVLVNQYPHKASILKGANNSGSGSNGGNGSGGGMPRFSRDEFAKLGPAKQMQVAADVKAGKAELTD